MTPAEKKLAHDLNQRLKYTPFRVRHRRPLSPRAYVHLHIDRSNRPWLLEKDGRPAGTYATLDEVEKALALPKKGVDRVITVQDVYAVLDEPQTCRDLEERLGVDHRTVRPHVLNLVESGHVEQVGVRVFTKGRSAALYRRKEIL